MSEVGWGERLLQERGSGLHAFLQNYILRVARHEQHLDIRPHSQNPLGKVTAPKFRHHNVAQQQVDLPRMRFACVQSFAPISSFQHEISTVLQDSGRELPDEVLILHQQDNFGGTLGRFSQTNRWPLVSVRKRLYARQKDLESRALSDFGVAPYSATALL